MRRMMKSSGLLFRAVIMGAVVFLGLGSGAVAQLPKSPAPVATANTEPSRPVDAEPNSTLASFGDWSLRCQRLGNGAETRRMVKWSSRSTRRTNKTRWPNSPSDG